MGSNDHLSSKYSNVERTEMLLRVLHLSNRFVANGTGITNMMADLSYAQLSQGMELCIATPDASSSLSIRAEQKGAHLVVIPALSSVRSIIRAAQTVRREHRRRPFDVVHVHTVKALAVTIIAGPKLFLRTVATLHNVHQKSAAFMLLARAPVCVSYAHTDQIKASFRWLGRRLRVVRNGTVDSTRVHPVDTIDAADIREPALLYVGGLNERKGVDLLLRNFEAVHREIPEAHLYLIGNRDNPEMERLAAGLDSSENIHFEGYHADPRTYMLAATALVVPSRREAFGLVVTDARSCSLPVIASNVDGLPEALSDGDAGILVAYEDQEAWVAQMKRVLTDESWRKELARRSNKGLSNFTVERMAAEYSTIYADIAGRQWGGSWFGPEVDGGDR